MKTTFILLGIFFSILSVYFLYLKHYEIMFSLLFLMFFSFIIAFAKTLSKHVKKVKVGNNETEFNSDETQIKNIAFELLENNFPKLTEVAEAEVTKRIKYWINDFTKTLKNEKFSSIELKIFYDPDFQFILNKAIETVGRRNNNLINKALVQFLIMRIKYESSNREDLMMQLDIAITNDIPRLTENHYKLMCLVLLLENIKTILGDITNIKEFNVVLKAFEKFLIKDVRCYEDLTKTIFIHNGGNSKLMYSYNIEKQDLIHVDTCNGKIERPPQMIENLFVYLAQMYPFLNSITSDEKQIITNSDIFKSCNELYLRILRYVVLYPLGKTLINDYGISIMNELSTETKEININ